MSSQHRATPEQWQAIEANGHLPTRSTILELLHRVETLEALTKPTHLIDTEREKTAQELAQGAGSAPRWPAVAFAPRWSEFDRRAASIGQPNHPAKPDSSLVELVAAQIENGNACDRDPNRIARQVIPVVAAWLRSRYGGQTAAIDFLVQEVMR